MIDLLSYTAMADLSDHQPGSPARLGDLTRSSYPDGGARLIDTRRHQKSPNAHTRWPGAWRVEGVTGSTNRHLVYVGLEIVEMGPHRPVENKLVLVLFMLFMQ